MISIKKSARLLLLLARMNMLAFYMALVRTSLSNYSTVMAYTTTLSSVDRPATLDADPLEKSPKRTKNEDITAAAATNRHKHIPWLIVGGGIHGVHIASRLIGNGGINPSNICIVDNHASLLHTWKSRTAATGMEYLRSSAGYHLDLDEHSLRCKFGAEGAGAVPGRRRNKNKKKKKENRVQQQQKKEKTAYFSKDYERPRLDIFNQHCDDVIEKYYLDKSLERGLVTVIEPSEEHVRVVISPTSTTQENNNDIVYNAENVVLALGNDDPSYADWVDEEDIKRGLVRHLLDDTNSHQSEDDSSLSNNENVGGKAKSYSVAVVGGGITAAHKVLELVQQSKQQHQNNPAPTIHLISRHPLKEQQFDTHQDWMMDRAASKRSEESGGYGMPLRQRNFNQCSCLKERRKIIVQERIPGTVTPAVHRGENGLCYAIKNGDVQFHQAEVLKKHYVYAEHDEECTSTDSQSTAPRMELILSCGDTIKVDMVLLATGFGKKRPGGKLIEDLIKNANLKVSDFDGFPIVDENLSWHKRIFVAGALAELELGPSARNIAGARLAAERILMNVDH